MIRNSSPYYFSYLTVWALCFTLSCQKNAPSEPDSTFFERQNAAHDGDYLATYPLSDADSCIARLKAEVPVALQPWGCLSIWYHMPRTNPEVNFRLLDLYEENYPHDTVFAFAQLVRGEFYVDLAQFEEAKICLEDAHDRYTRLNRPLDAGDAIYLLARSYSFRNNYADALKTYFNVLDLLNLHDTTFTHRRAYLYRDISIVYRNSGNKLQQLIWLKKMWSADLSKVDNPWEFRAYTAADLSSYYLTENPDSSIIWAQMAIDIFKAENESSPPLTRFVYKLARAYLNKGECQTALPYFLDAYRRNTDQSSLFAYYQYGHALGECYLCVGKLDSAEIYLNESLATPDTGNLANAYELLGEVYGKKQMYQKAWLAEKKGAQLTKTKITSDRIKATADADARYQLAQKAYRIQTLESEHQITRQKYLITSLLGLLLVGILLFRYQRQHTKHKLLEQERSVLEQEKLLLDQAKEIAETNERLKTQELLLAQKDLIETKAQLHETIDILSLKNQLVEELQLHITDANTQASSNGEGVPDEHLTSMKILTPADWVLFQRRFDEQLPGILPKLHQDFPNLTSAETRLFLLIKLGFETSEIAETLGIARDSVWRSRHRLRKKLNLPDTNELDSFIGAFYALEQYYSPSRQDL